MLLYLVIYLKSIMRIIIGSGLMELDRDGRILEIKSIKNIQMYHFINNLIKMENIFLPVIEARRLNNIL